MSQPSTFLLLPGLFFLLLPTLEVSQSLRLLQNGEWLWMGPLVNAFVSCKYLRLQSLD